MRWREFIKTPGEVFTGIFVLKLRNVVGTIASWSGTGTVSNSRAKGNRGLRDHLLSNVEISLILDLIVGIIWFRFTLVNYGQFMYLNVHKLPLNETSIRFKRFYTKYSHFHDSTLPDHIIRPIPLSVMNALRTQTDQILWNSSPTAVEMRVRVGISVLVKEWLWSESVSRRI